MSLPVWGEWIEIIIVAVDSRVTKSLPVWGEWIEIVICPLTAGKSFCLSPCGESGLK